jgi:hypothetical protein
MRSRFRSFFALFGVLALGAAAMVALAPAAVADTIGPVDSSIPDGDIGSLRDILQGEAEDGDVIVLQAGATYQLTDCEQGDLDTNTDVTVQGNGATIEQTCDELVWDMNGDVVLDSVTITGGFDVQPRPGGAIHLDGQNLTITNSSIVNNQTCGDGGAIYIHSEGAGTLHIENSTIAGNSAAGGGGAIAGSSDGETEVEVVNSTITGNSGGWGGAFDLQNGEDLSLTYVTLAGNTADAAGIECDEISEEAVDDPHGGVEAPVRSLANGSAANIQFDDEGSVLSTFASVIALPVEGPNCSLEPEDVIKSLDALENTESHGYNYSDDESCGLAGTGDRQGAADPQLLPLGPNGGPTETRPPAETSPLVDGVPLAQCQADGAAGIATDQRGITRPQRNGCDIGAVELVALTPTPEPAPAAIVTPRFTG